MDKGVTSYLIFRLILGVLDIVFDVLIIVHLLVHKGNLFWAMLSLAWILLGVLTSIIGVTIGRCKTGDSMSCGKFYLLCLRCHAELVQGFFHAGPQLITQLAIFWSGLYTYPSEAYLSPQSADWFWAWLEVVSPVISFISLIVTGVKHNQEPGPGLRQASYILTQVITCLYRVLVLSLILKLAPLASSLILALLYTVMASLFKFFGDGLPLLSNAYFSIYFPFGHTFTVGAKPGYISTTSGLREVERARINHEGLMNRVLKYFSVQSCLSLLLIVPYITFIEVWLMADSSSYETHPIIKNRLFTYLAAFILLLLSYGSYAIYYLQSLRARKAARTWSGLNSGGRSLLSPSSMTSEVGRPSSIQLDRVGPERNIARPASVSGDQFHPSAPPPSEAPSYPQPPAGYGAARLPPTAGDSYIPEERAGSPGLYPPLPNDGGGVRVQERLPPGSRKCSNDDCVTCAWVLEGPVFCSTITQKEYRFMTPVTCMDSNIIYLITCRKCRKQYVGKTQQTLRQRHYGHRREIDTKSSPLGQHFAETCGMDNLRIQIIDQCNSSELLRREGYWQKELGTMVPLGLNIRKERNEE